MEHDLSEKKKILIDALKAAYKVQYDAIQPIPYIKDGLYCVGKVFVNASIHFSVANEAGVRGEEISWQRLKSYKSIYSDPRIKSTRRILEGGPGYGKSTLTLQLAYDWCNNARESPLSDVEILILLRLRQLGGVTSIYRAIKRFILSKSRLSDKDIEYVLHNSSSVEILFDGYDEYPDRDKGTGNDVISIIMADMFSNHRVTLTTRYMPKRFPKVTKRLRLSGFDNHAREEYIRKAVVGDDEKAIKHIKRRLQENPFLVELCKVPIFFILFSHIAHEKHDFKKLKSFTSVFNYLITALHEHMRNKARYDNVKKLILKYETEHSELNKLAYESLGKKDHQLVWNKDELCEYLGQAFYDQYVRIGIFVEEQVLSRSNTIHTAIYTTEVRFYHKLFCEFYAAQYVVKFTLASEVYELGRLLGRIDPFYRQYVYRFACGLNSIAGRKIINHLKKVEDGDKFIIPCILEQTAEDDSMKETIRKLCLSKVTVDRSHSRLLNKSTIQLLEIAARHDFPIYCLWLNDSSPRVDEAGLNLIMESGHSLSILSSLQGLVIDDDRRLTNEEFVAILSYSSHCTSLKELKFYNYGLPDTVPVESIPAFIKSRNLKVLQTYNGVGLQYRRLNFKTGRWEIFLEGDPLQICRIMTVNTSGSSTRKHCVKKNPGRNARYIEVIFTMLIQRGPV